MISPTKTIREEIRKQIERYAIRYTDPMLKVLQGEDKRNAEEHNRKLDEMLFMIDMACIRISHQSRLQTIEEIEKEVIGEDEQHGHIINRYPGGTVQIEPAIIDRNRLRSEQRSKLSKLKEQKSHATMGNNDQLSHQTTDKTDRSERFHTPADKIKIIREGSEKESIS